MFIRVIDQGLERLLRTALPLAPDAGDISFAAPTGAWAERVSRPTVNLFLYEIRPTSRPAPASTRRVDAEGRAQRRLPSPVLEMNYLVSAWASSPLAEHELLGNVANHLSIQPALPDKYLPDESASSVQLIFGGDSENKLRDIWQALGGRLKASFTLSAITAADAYPWTAQAPPVTRVVRGVSPRP